MFRGHFLYSHRYLAPVKKIRLVLSIILVALLILILDLKKGDLHLKSHQIYTHHQHRIIEIVQLPLLGPQQLIALGDRVDQHLLRLDELLQQQRVSPVAGHALHRRAGREHALIRLRRQLLIVQSMVAPLIRLPIIIHSLLEHGLVIL